MDLTVFSDESGVFDRVHNDIFVFGGIVFFSKEERDNCTRKYIHAEKTLRSTGAYSQEEELKAATICVDQHTTATNGRYELEQALEQEFKSGTYNQTWSVFYPPLFHQLEKISVTFCNSAQKPLIRAADIIANRIYYLACQQPDKLSDCGVFLSRLP